MWMEKKKLKLDTLELFDRTVKLAWFKGFYTMKFQQSLSYNIIGVNTLILFCVGNVKFTW